MIRARYPVRTHGVVEHQTDTYFQPAAQIHALPRLPPLRSIADH